VGGPPRKLLRASINALRIEGRSNVNSPKTTRSFKNNAIESICPMPQAITYVSASASHTAQESAASSSLSARSQSFAGVTSSVL
jgi:hypothetical protein